MFCTIWCRIFGDTGCEIILVENNIFNDCFAKEGGGIYGNKNSKIHLKNNNSFINCSAKYNGGGINVFEYGKVWVDENNVFNSCSAKEGGGIYCLKSLIFVGINNTFKNNKAISNGGAMSLHTGNIIMDNSKNIFIDNLPDDVYEY